VAAVQCKPNAAVVRDMAYYLMELEDAEAVVEARQNQYVPKNAKAGKCRNGKPSWDIAVPFGREACYRNEDGRANLRFAEGAGNCRQVTAGATQIKSPAFYVAVLGKDGKIKKLWDWADGRKITKQIKQPGAKQSPMCPS
jgi:hypothetical protein